jgi:hypothetical protein
MENSMSDHADGNLTDDFSELEVELSERSYAENTPLEEHIQRHNAEHLILLLHGIRTPGDWMRDFMEYGFQLGTIAIRQVGFQRVSSFEFALKRDFSKVENLILSQINHALDKFPHAQVSFICHSFGSKLLASIVEKINPRRHIHAVIFLGGVCPQSDGLSVSSNCDILINDCGNKDVWPIIAHIVNNRHYEYTGYYGFRGSFAFDRYFMCDHGGYLTKEHFNNNIVPIFRHKVVPPNPEPRVNPIIPYAMASYARRALFVAGICIVGLPLGAFML